MASFMRKRLSCLVASLVWLAAAVAWAQTPQQPAPQPEPPQPSAFERGFFLQVHDRNFAGAVAAFEQALADPGTPEHLRLEAQSRLADCREDLVADDLAALAPPDTMAYIEIVKPGEYLTRHFERLAILRQVPVPQAPVPEVTEPQPVVPEAPVPETPVPEPVPASVAEGDPAVPAHAAPVLLPARPWLSPALVDELNKIRGLAFAVSAIGQDGSPDVLLVLHPGDSDLIRGLIDTGLLAAQAAEPIGGHRAYVLPGPVWIAATARMFIVSRSREQLEAALARLAQPGSNSLATQFDFKFFASGRGQGPVFAHVSVFKVVGAVSAIIAGATADSTGGSEHVGSALAAASAINSDIQVEASLALVDGHGKSVYDLVRGAPLTRQTMAHIPRGAAAVAVLSMHPAQDDSLGQPLPPETPTILPQGPPQQPPALELTLHENAAHANPAQVNPLATSNLPAIELHKSGEFVSQPDEADLMLPRELPAVDDGVVPTRVDNYFYATLREIGRQVFSGVEEIGFFVLPSQSPGENGIGMPELGLVLALDNAAMLQMRVDQAFLIATLVGAPAVQPPRDLVIEGKAAREYSLPGHSPITVVRMDEHVLVAATRGAAAAAVLAATPGGAIAHDAQYAATLSALPPRTSKLVFISAGRILRMTGVFQRWPKLAPVDALVEDLKAIVATDEAPTLLTVRLTIAGLPGIPNLVRALMALGG